MISLIGMEEHNRKKFFKIVVKPGETITVTTHLDKEAFWFYDPAQSAWITQPGEFEILVGASSQDIRLIGKVELAFDEIQHNTRLHTALKLRIILDDQQGFAIFSKHFGEWVKAPDLQKVLEMTLDEIAAFAPDIVTPEKLYALAEDLSKI